METQRPYDLTGIHGAEVFRDLPEGLKLRMTTGEVVEIVANAHDGAILIVKVVDNAQNPTALVGDEQTIFYADVQEVAY